MAFEFANTESCGQCRQEITFTVKAILQDNTIITPIEPITCPQCHTTYHYNAQVQQWQPTNQSSIVNPKS